MAGIVFFENDAPVRKILCHTLIQFGHTVIAACIGKEGPELFHCLPGFTKIYANPLA